MFIAYRISYENIDSVWLNNLGCFDIVIQKEYSIYLAGDSKKWRFSPKENNLDQS